jgi:hypothetical protein
MGLPPRPPPRDVHDSATGGLSGRAAATPRVEHRSRGKRVVPLGLKA